MTSKDYREWQRLRDLRLEEMDRFDRIADYIGESTKPIASGLMAFGMIALPSLLALALTLGIVHLLE